MTVLRVVWPGLAGATLTCAWLALAGCPLWIVGQSLAISVAIIVGIGATIVHSSGSGETLPHIDK